MLVLLGLTGCGSGSDESADAGAGLPRVVATTTMLEDLARVLGGTDIEVIGIMRAGEDPHVYEVRPKDAQTIANADLVLMNGFHLESTLERIAEANAVRPPVRVAERAVAEPIGADGAPDPHVWMDPTLWSEVAAAAAEAIAAVGIEPEAVARVNERLAAYQAALAELDAGIAEGLSAIPERQRVIVTSHDAFNYFARRYGVEVHGVIGISTDQQPRPQDIEALMDQIRERGVRAVFIETSATQTLNQVVRKVASDTGVALGGSLYSDSLGAPGSGGDTYLTMLRSNADTIVSTLADPELTGGDDGGDGGE